MAQASRRWLKRALTLIRWRNTSTSSKQYPRIEPAAVQSQAVAQTSTTNLNSTLPAVVKNSNSFQSHQATTSPPTNTKTQSESNYPEVNKLSEWQDDIDWDTKPEPQPDWEVDWD